MEEAQRIFELAGAVILSTGAGGTIVFGLSNWLGKLWAERIFQAERVRYEEYLKGIQHQLNSEIE